MNRIAELEKRLSQLEAAFSKLKCVQQSQIASTNSNQSKLKEIVFFFETQGWSVGDIARGLRCSESEIKMIIGN